jgi:hypothetical protein
MSLRPLWSTPTQRWARSRSLPPRPRSNQSQNKGTAWRRGGCGVVPGRNSSFCVERLSFVDLGYESLHGKACDNPHYACGCPDRCRSHNRAGNTGVAEGQIARSGDYRQSTSLTRTEVTRISPRRCSTRALSVDRGTLSRNVRAGCVRHAPRAIAVEQLLPLHHVGAIGYVMERNGYPAVVVGRTSQPMPRLSECHGCGRWFSVITRIARPCTAMPRHGKS